MNCEACGCKRSIVMATRRVEYKNGLQVLRRRRECGRCMHRQTTIELLPKDIQRAAAAIPMKAT